ncbi:hypothetical protein HIM_00167 [Hirsutella minnesotensis 3608]|nr:hypothetical protein HIM_00167 [Hirsutella minnesotensis 3608]
MPHAAASSSSRTPPPPPSARDGRESSSKETSSANDKALPAPGDGTDVVNLDVSGDGTTVKLGALGPLVVNQDGTMSRISNWAEMSPIERENTLRILGKRNRTRLDALKKALDTDK